MKVAQEIDVDNVTIIINPQNKLEAKIPESSGSVEIEEIDANLWFTLDQGLVVHKNDTNTNHPLSKLGRVKGTDWLVFQTDAPLVVDEPVTPVKPEPEQPPVTDTDWSFITYCEQDESKEPVYENTFTGAKLTGTLPDGVTAVHLVLENGEELQFPVRTDRIYKYNIDPRGHESSGRYVKTIKLITPQGELTKSVAHPVSCPFISMPEY